MMTSPPKITFGFQRGFFIASPHKPFWLQHIRTKPLYTCIRLNDECIFWCLVKFLLLSGKIYRLYWYPINFLRSNGLNQWSLTNGRQRPISILPRATPWAVDVWGCALKEQKPLCLFVYNCFAHSGRKPWLQQHPGRCTGLMDLSPFRGNLLTGGLTLFE